MKYFNTESIISIANDILKDGTEGDRQLEVFRSNGMNSLKEYLVNDVDYTI